MTEVTRLLLDWYSLNARDLPWRRLSDPYAIWISEIMLQQTQVDTVIPYFKRWMERFPTLPDLANASEQEVLQTWEGLGYYSRARNLQQAAGIVLDMYEGMLPADRRMLEKLPGIGPYTSGAIASIAFNKDEAALDGNIRRVLSRIFNIGLPARSTEGEKLLWETARQNLPKGRASEYNQALMDLGAGICTPRAPHCEQCPVKTHCQAHALGIEEDRPVTEARPPIPHYTVAAAVIQRDGRVLIARRPSKGLLGGLWEFPGGKQEAGETLPEGLKREIIEELDVPIAVNEPFGIYRHAFTHFRVTLHAFLCTLEDGKEPRALEASALYWALPGELPGFPMGKIDRQIASKILSMP